MVLAVRFTSHFYPCLYYFYLGTGGGGGAAPGLALAPHVHGRALVLHSSRKALEIAPGRYHPSYPVDKR